MRVALPRYLEGSPGMPIQRVQGDLEIYKVKGSADRLVKMRTKDWAAPFAA